MSVFFPRFNELSPIFRLADELDRAARYHPLNNSQSQVRSFSPRFDLKETKEAYELHGDLPGLDQANVNIEWADERTLTIGGHTETRYESKSPTEEAEEVSDEGSTNNGYQKPTVEDEDGATDSKKSNEIAVAKTSEDGTVAKADANAPKYWVSERSVGSFHRSFQFPGRVDHENVKASMKNGVLNIVVPKAKPREPRRVAIE